MRPLLLLAILGTPLLVGCNRSDLPPVTMLPDWQRTRYQAGNDRALVYFVIYGQFTDDVAVSRTKYRTAGLPEGFAMQRLDRKQDGPLPFTSGDFYKVVDDTNLFERVKQSSECMLLRGEVTDPTTLNYLRDSVGMVTFLLDHGGFAVCDPQQFELFDADGWRRDIFEEGATNLLKHVKILYSDGPDGRWYHTRGLRKFARPDLSVRGVPVDSSAGVIELCNRLILLHAMGGRIPEGQEVRMASLPAGLICHHGGELDDPDFNNVHVEIRWPVGK